MNYQLNYPEKIIFGNDTSSQLPELLPEGAQVMLVTGKSAVKSGVADKFLKLLPPNCVNACGMSIPEPTLCNVDQLIDLGRKDAVTAIVAVGGGSTIDAAKAAAALIPLEGTTEEYFYGNKELTGKGLFFAALPTTAGTGAEITKNSVLTDPEKRIKKSLRSPEMVPDLAIIDPLLTLNMPSGVTAASGMDALTQAIESFTSLSANSATRALAKSAVEKIMNSLLPAYKNGDEVIHRVNMAEGSMLAAMAFSQSGLGAVHALAHPIGALLKLAHGLTCSILLLPVMRWNASICGELYKELAVACDLKDKEEFFEKISEMRKAMNIPDNFHDLGLNESHFPFIVENCRSNSMRCNPREMTDQDVLATLWLARSFHPSAVALRAMAGQVG